MGDAGVLSDLFKFLAILGSSQFKVCTYTYIYITWQMLSQSVFYGADIYIYMYVCIYIWVYIDVSACVCGELGSGEEVDGV